MFCYQSRSCGSSTRVGSGRCSSETSCFCFLDSSWFRTSQKSHVCHQKLEVVAFDVVKGGRVCFHLKRHVTGVPEEADNVLRGEFPSCPLPLF